MMRIDRLYLTQGDVRRTSMASALSIDHGNALFLSRKDGNICLALENITMQIFVRTGKSRLSHAFTFLC
jgi:hypothetical protein